MSDRLTTVHPALIPLFVTVIVATMVSPAAAQTIEAVDEATETHCPAVILSGTDVDGGCLTHLVSEGSVELRKHVFGIESHITNCVHELHGRIDEDAEGYVFEQALSGAGCQRRACVPSGMEPAPWEANGFEGIPQSITEGTEYLTTSLCLEPIGGGTDEPCEIDIPFQGYANQHRQEYGHATEISSHGVSGFRCELVGHWNSETGGSHDGASEQEIVLRHVDDLEQEIVFHHVDDLEQEVIFTHVER